MTMWHSQPAGTAKGVPLKTPPCAMPPKFRRLAHAIPHATAVPCHSAHIPVSGMDSPYRRAARQRWPKYTIRGDGAYAVICPVCSLVTLYEWVLLAATQAAEPHSNWRCADKHKLEHVEPAPMAEPFFVSKIWED